MYLFYSILQLSNSCLSLARFFRLKYIGLLPQAFVYWLIVGFSRACLIFAIFHLDFSTIWRFVNNLKETCLNNVPLATAYSLITIKLEDFFHFSAILLSSKSMQKPLEVDSDNIFPGNRKIVIVYQVSLKKVLGLINNNV